MTYALKNFTFIYTTMSFIVSRDATIKEPSQSVENPRVDHGYPTVNLERPIPYGRGVLNYAPQT